MYDVIITAVFSCLFTCSCINATINNSNFYVSILESEVCHGRFLTEKQLYTICLIFWLQVAAWLAAAVLLLLFVIYVVLMVAYCYKLTHRGRQYSRLTERTVKPRYGATKTTNPFDWLNQIAGIKVPCNCNSLCIHTVELSVWNDTMSLVCDFEWWSSCMSCSPVICVLEGNWC